MRKIETGQFLNKIPFTKVGSGSRYIVAFDGGSAFFQRFSKARASRAANRIARILPPDCTLWVLGYDPTPPANYSFDAITSDFAKIIQTEIGTVTVLGISFGGFVATRFAARHPDLVENLILLVSAHRLSEEGRFRVERQIAQIRRGDFYGMAREFGTIFRKPWFNVLLKLKLWTERKTLHEKMAPPDVIIRSLDLILMDDLERSRACLANVRAQTLIVAGKRDQVFDVRALQETAHLIPSARLELFEHETHALPIERPRDVAKVIAAFLTNA